VELTEHPIILLRATPNARICLNLAKENPHIEQTTRFYGSMRLAELRDQKFIDKRLQRFFKTKVCSGL
jgi:hypothetical protein